MERLTFRDESGKAQPTKDVQGEYITQLLEKVAHYEDLEEHDAILKLNAPIDEIIRCTICTNPMRGVTYGCDGNCSYDKKLLEKLVKALVK